MKRLYLKTLLSNNLQIWFITLLFVVSCNIFGSNSDNENVDKRGEWSDPQLFYLAPDTSEILRFDVTVYNDNINVATWRRQFSNNQFLDYSQILMIRGQIGGEANIQELTSKSIPSENPLILRDNVNTSHMLWGDRRQDPDFEQWEVSSRSQLTNFSTNVVYTRYNGTGFEPPVSIYEGNLSTFGVGDIGFPLQLVEAEDRRLHTVFKADSMARTTDTMGDSVTAFIPRLVYMNRSREGAWSEPRFLFINYKNNPNSLSGGDPVIAAPTTNRLVVAFLSSVGGINDILTITSDDGGQTWSEAQLLFSSERERSLFLTMSEAAGGRLHLVWARVIGNRALPEEMWHSYSEDAGRTWSQPASFFTLRSPTFTPEGSPEPAGTIISDYDILVDESERVHWAGIEVFFGDSLRNKIHYTTWDPGTKTWEESSLFEFSTEPRQVNLTFDITSQRLYLFWEERLEKTVFYSVKSVR